MSQWRRAFQRQQFAAQGRYVCVHGLDLVPIIAFDVDTRAEIDVTVRPSRAGR